MIVTFLQLVVVALGISSMVWPSKLTILLPIAVIILGLIPWAANLR